jgi:signal transduction histidine kinase/CheY-like chemotaxis protein/HAMP domain-containing protein
MVDQLSSFADEVTRVAREVGTEGKLGGQANVEGVSGVWGDLTDNVNFMATSLTTQVRAIADVSMAVTQGDLTQSITVETQGEVAELKDRINQMIVNLRETTARNAEQAWLSSNLARFSGSMQGQRDLGVVSNLIMSELTPLVGAHQGAFFLVESHDDGRPVLGLAASYGLTKRRGMRLRVRAGEGLVGQAVVEKKPILLTDAPPSYLRISSALGEAAPVNVIVLPVLFEDRVMGVIELASFSPFSDVHLAFFEQLAETVGIVINAIVANMRTEELLQQSQSLTQELQKQQRELQQTNDELAEKNERIEVKNTELDMARLAIEEKAEQLALSSRYKSEFLANMSHELRTPLNSLLILAKLLADNGDRNLTDKQVEFARTIFAAGNDLLALIDDILDLSKVEAGKMTVVPSEVGLAHIVDYVDRSFRPLIEQKGLTFAITIDPDVPATVVTDEQRLQQVLRNLLSNAVKFTETGGVYLDIHVAPPGEPDDEQPRVAFSVRDTGIGIASERLALIFEPFQQADGTTSRRFGGTGLGLSISREIAKLLSGTIEVRSSVERGSTFTLVVPERLEAPGVSSGIEVDELGAGGSAARPEAVVERVGIVEDDRDDLAPDDRVLLVVEDDPDLARTMAHVAREAGFKCVVALRGDTGVALAHQFRPDAILLDVRLPVIDGAAVIDHLERHPHTRGIPVHVISGADAPEALRAAAATFLEKPVTDELLRDLLSALAAATEATSPRETAAPPDDLSFSGRRALIVDDDVRNVFALASALERHGLDVVYAENGTEAIRALEREPIDIVLMDVMMPELDGYQTMRTIRSLPALAGLPIIAVTAKAMKGDRERSIASGASDYITKPVDADQLLSLLGVWLYDPEGDATASLEAPVA